MNKPTVKQINFAKDLLEQLGKEDEYDFLEITESWTREEVSELIDSLVALRDEKVKAVVEAAKKLIKSAPATGSKEGRADYCRIITDDKIHTLRKALADLEGGASCE